QAFALLVLVYTVSDVRYRFRVETAPIPFWRMTFWICAPIGVGTLVTDFWVTRNFPVPWFLANQAYWQFVLGLMFLSIVLTWLDTGRFYMHSYALYRAFGIIKYAASDLYKLGKNSTGPEAEDIRCRRKLW